MTALTPDAVLLVAHGTVQTLEELPEFLQRIRHGRPVSDVLLAETTRRYRLIGGSPLLEITRNQAALLSKHLNLPVFVGMRLWEPSVERALRDAASAGIRRLCVLPLAPFSADVYAQAARASLASVQAELPHELALVTPSDWGAEPDFIAGQAELVANAPGFDEAAVVLTAHSLPLVAIRAGDRYQAGVEACSRAIGDVLGRPCRLAYQSQGADGGEWLGPDLRQTLESLRAEGARKVVLAPIGFLADHVETLYDLDVEARAWASELNLDFLRVAALNEHPRLIAALAAVARRVLND
ncbi:MAG TPA: ferrochelatase [Polyangiaceae bacterium]|jgi:ferrochelatase